MTADNGSEFAFHYKLADPLAIPTYFADAYSAYQRGTNEHFNGRIRKYFPKGTSFEDLSQAELDEFVTEINNRPRKILGWATPAEVFQELGLKSHDQLLHFKLEHGIKRRLYAEPQLRSKVLEFIQQADLGITDSTVTERDAAQVESYRESLENAGAHSNFPTATSLMAPGRMDPVLSRDQIWFVEKDTDGASSLFSVADFPVRNDENAFRKYLSG